jgi:hypothetical protein
MELEIKYDEIFVEAYRDVYNNLEKFHPEMLQQKELFTDEITRNEEANDRVIDILARIQKNSKNLPKLDSNGARELHKNVSSVLAGKLYHQQKDKIVKLDKLLENLEKIVSNKFEPLSAKEIINRIGTHNDTDLSENLAEIKLITINKAIKPLYVFSSEALENLITLINSGKFKGFKGIYMSDSSDKENLVRLLFYMIITNKTLSSSNFANKFNIYGKSFELIAILNNFNKSDHLFTAKNIEFIKLYLLDRKEFLVFDKYKHNPKQLLLLALGGIY